MGMCPNLGEHDHSVSLSLAAGVWEISKRRDAALELNGVDYSSLHCSARMFISVAS